MAFLATALSSTRKIRNNTGPLSAKQIQHLTGRFFVLKWDNQKRSTAPTTRVADDDCDEEADPTIRHETRNEIPRIL
jgi:hypothetical protein